MTGMHLNGTCDSCVAATTTAPVVLSAGSCAVVGFHADSWYVNWRRAETRKLEQVGLELKRITCAESEAEGIA